MSGGFHKAGCCCGVATGQDCEHCTAARTPLNFTVTLHNAAFPALDGVAVVCVQDQATPQYCQFNGSVPDPGNPPYTYAVTITAPNTLTVSIRYWVGGYDDVFIHVGADFTGSECDEVNLLGLANQDPPFAGTADVVAGP